MIFLNSLKIIFFITRYCWFGIETGGWRKRFDRELLLLLMIFDMSIFDWSSLGQWPLYRPADWGTGWLTGWLDDWLTDLLTDCLKILHKHFGLSLHEIYFIGISNEFYSSAFMILILMPWTRGSVATISWFTVQWNFHQINPYSS